MRLLLAKEIALVALGVCVGCGEDEGRPQPSPAAGSPTPSIVATRISTPTSLATPVSSETADETPPLAFAVGGNDVLRSEDGGLTWSEVLRAQVGAVAFVDRDDGWVAGATTDGGHLFHTHDSGRRWHDEAPTLSGPTPLLFDVAALDAQHAVAVGSENGFLHPEHFHRGPPVAVVTHDGGATWERAPLAGVDLTDLEDVALGSVCVTTSGIGLAAGMDLTTFARAIVLLTHDGGETWNDVTMELPSPGFGTVACVGDGDLWLSGGSTLLHSGDGGASWADLGSHLPRGGESARRGSAISVRAGSRRRTDATAAARIIGSWCSRPRTAAGRGPSAWCLRV